MSRLIRAALALSGTLAFALPAASAGAASTVTDPGHVSINTGTGWTRDPSTPLFDFSRISPGWTASATLGVRNDSRANAALTLRTTGVNDDENGCNHPESFVDTTCTGKNAGELGAEIVLRVFGDSDNDGTFDNTPTWTGNIRDLEGAGSLGELGAGVAHNYKIDAELPYSSGNETQTDKVSFDLVVSLDGAGVEVEGTKTTRSTGSGTIRQVIDRLPLTGTPAERLVAASLWLILAGAAIVLLARQQGRRRAA